MAAPQHIDVVVNGSYGPFAPVRAMLHLRGSRNLRGLLRANSVEKFLLIWGVVADSIVLLILEFDRDDGATSGSTNCSVL